MAQSEATYAEKAAGQAKSAYNVAMVDGYHPPQADEIDLTGYTGEGGEVIRAKVVDDVQVEAVNVVITTDTDVLVEQGQMTHDQGLWYTYITTADCPAGSARVIVTGLDSPGYVGTNEETLMVVLV